MTESVEIVSIGSERVFGQPLFDGDVIEIDREVGDEEGGVAGRGSLIAGRRAGDG